MRIMEAYSVLLPLDSFICFSKDFICAMDHFISSFMRFLDFPPSFTFLY